MKTFARIERGHEVAHIVLQGGMPIPEGDWRPVVVEGLDFDRTAYRETGRDTVIAPDRVVRRIIIEPIERTEADYAAAIREHIEATAQSRGYLNSVMLASYAASTVPAWAEEARTFVAWRDAVWLNAFEYFNSVKAGITPKPTIAEFIDRLPLAGWTPP